MTEYISCETSQEILDTLMDDYGIIRQDKAWHVCEKCHRESSCVRLFENRSMPGDYLEIHECYECGFMLAVFAKE